MFLAAGLGSILGGLNFFKKECLSKFFYGQNEENSHHVTKIINRLCICQQKKIESLDLIYCLHCVRRFQKFGSLKNFRA